MTAESVTVGSFVVAWIVDPGPRSIESKSESDSRRRSGQKLAVETSHADDAANGYRRVFTL